MLINFDLTEPLCYNCNLYRCKLIWGYTVEKQITDGFRNNRGVEVSLNINANNQVAAGELLFIEGEKPEAAYIVLKGKIKVYNSSFSTIMGAGALLAVEDYINGVFSYCAMVQEDAVVYAFLPENGNAVLNLITPHREYCGPAVYSGIKLMSELDRQFSTLQSLSEKTYGFLQESYEIYLEECRQTGCEPELIPEIRQLENSKEITMPEDANLELYREYARIPYETIKSFYSASAILSVRLVNEISAASQLAADACSELADYLYSCFYLLCADEEKSLYKNFLILDLDSKKHGLPSTSAIGYANKCYTLGHEIMDFYTEKTGRELISEADALRLESMKEMSEKGLDIRTNKKAKKAGAVTDVSAEMNNLLGSAEQIMKYAKYPDDAAAELREVLEQYIALPDRESQDDGLRSLRKKLTEHFYSLYGLAFGAAFGKSRKLPRAVELFLDYGYLSERLLEKRQLEELLRISPVTFNTPCQVFTIRQWMTAIYKGEREPSRNDLGQDFSEVLRELRKQGRITEEKEEELKTNPAMRLDYELKNMFAKVNRLCSGQLTTFVPILHSEQLIGDATEAFNSSKKINEIIVELSQLDYSIFYREALFVDTARGVERETIQKEVFPDIILCPTVGSNIMMWQEITGRKRDTRGRFIAPILSYGSLRDMLIKAMGEFRWALCKTVQGANWNNIQYKSLTSEYSDYIQFYRKNRDLSDEKKEKLKLQIQRGRNSLSRIFTMDYETWIKSESAGSVKLNKVVREMMATYCPFKADVKMALQKQPLYEEAFSRLNREKVKKIHELELRYRAIEKTGAELPEELVATMRYYKEL